MSTAVLDAPAEAEHQRRLAEYVMPEVLLGQFVMVYPDRGQNEQAGVLAKVMGIDRLFIMVEMTGTKDFPQTYLTHKYQVRHRTDPRLVTANEHVLKYGCWDYTPWEKALRARLNDLEAKVEKLVNDLGGPTTKGKKTE